LGEGTGIRDSAFGIRESDLAADGGALRPHQRLAVWRDAIDLVEATYRASLRFPSDERFGLTAQMRRSAVSVASNIAEGAARGSRADYLRFLAIARGSLSELDTQFLIAARLGYLHDGETISEKVDRTYAKLNALMSSLQRPKKAVALPNPESRIPNP
jgi:four helix bundle protein